MPAAQMALVPPIRRSPDPEELEMLAMAMQMVIEPQTMPISMAIRRDPRVRGAM